MSGKSQRIRDPLHDLITFEGPQVSQLEGSLWQVLQSRPFQRLRRIKQLGFSEFVYPGATHTRFAHSVGVFHTARTLMEIVRRRASSRQDTRENHALAAALLHDVGHGPFSHAFEKVGKRLGLKLAHHEAFSEELIRKGEIAEILNREMGTCFSDDVADILKKDGVTKVHHAVVSSQFDADRLDYIRRDRFMAGSQHAGIDFRWLISNLEIAEVPRGVDDQPLGNIETFVIGPKAVYAAEAFVLGLFQLYPTVYFHKATRCAERIFEELLVRVFHLVHDNGFERTGLPKNHPLIRFGLNPSSAASALELDDTVIWGGLSMMTEAEDLAVSSLARRLRDRSLLKCVDIRTAVAREIDPQSSNSDPLVESIDRCCAAIREKLTERYSADKNTGVCSVLFDEDERSPYKGVDRSKGPLDRINVQVEGGSGVVDLAERSSVVKALKSFKLSRAYIERENPDLQVEVNNLIREEIEKCRKI